MPTVYLIHFERPYVAKTGKQQKKAGHYLGWTINLERRMTLHRTGQGAKLLRVCKENRIGWSIARIWEGEGRELEVKLKRSGHFARRCPCCNQKIRHLMHGNGNDEARR